jgi:O-antigen/teichoic acid export membrane protein
MVRYGSMAYLARLLQFLNYRVDYWIVQHFRDDEALGLYSLASSLAMMLWMLPRAAASVLLPATAAGDVGATAVHAARMARVSVGVGAALMVPLVPFAHWWIGLLFGEDFTKSATPFVILLTGCIPFIASIVLASSLAGINRLDVNLRASGTGLIATIILDILLIPKWGLEGAAVASATSYLVTTGIVVVSFSRMYGIPIRAYLIPTRSDFKYLADGFRRILR